MWLAYFALLATFRSVGWSVELWAGVNAMSALVGFGLALHGAATDSHSAEAPGPRLSPRVAISQVDLRSRCS